MERRKFIKGAALVGGAAASTLATPAIAQAKKEMVIVSTWPRDFPGLGISAQRLAARITELTEGAITTTYFAAGERVGAFDVFDDVASGNSQAYIAADYYWVGKHPAFAYFTSVPFGMTSPEWNAWIKFKGGQALWDELSGSFGLKALPCGGTGTQMGGWFNKEINSADDLKGLKMRIPGQGGDGNRPNWVDLLFHFRAGKSMRTWFPAPLMLPSGSARINDFFMKFYEAAKYLLHRRACMSRAVVWHSA